MELYFPIGINELTNTSYKLNLRKLHRQNYILLDDSYHIIFFCKVKYNFLIVFYIFVIF